MEERRRLERFELTAPARLTVASQSRGKAPFEFVTRDISSDGAYLYCTQPFAEGSRVKMELLLSVDKLSKLAGEKRRAKIRIKGVVVRVGSDGVAIRFESGYKIHALEDGDATIEEF
jgi:hypothetical protein